MPPASMPVPTVDTPAAATGIAGVAMVGPACPVERLDTPYPDCPFEGTTRLKVAFVEGACGWLPF